MSSLINKITIKVGTASILGTIDAGMLMPGGIDRETYTTYTDGSNIEAFTDSQLTDASAQSVTVNIAPTDDNVALIAQWKLKSNSETLEQIDVMSLNTGNLITTISNPIFASNGGVDASSNTIECKFVARKTAIN